MKSGYVMVDCTGFDFSNVGKVDGIYNKMLSAYDSGKFVLCEHMVNGSAKFSPIPAFLATAKSGSTNYIVLTVMNIAYNITEDDNISTDVPNARTTNAKTTKNK
ncbi:MAG: hypothetical protein IJ944_02830 [Clostridia bacterium]|nr:hypothetical protein [Clostridia bacterium]